MARGTKIVVALGLTLALHAVVAIYALGPRLSGLTRDKPETVAVADAAAPENAVMPETVKPKPDDQKTAAPSEPPLEVSLVQAPTDIGPQPEQKAEAQTPAKVEKATEPVAEKPAAEKPADKPVIRAEEKPAEKIAAKSAAAKPAEKPLEKPVDKKAAQLAAKAAEAAQKAAAKTAEMAQKAAAKAAAAKPVPASKPPATTGKPSAATAPVLSADSGYANRVRQHLAKFAGALPPGANGEARVQFVVQPDGRVTDVHLVRFSGNTGLDTVALKLPTEAQPLPLPGATAQRLEVPVQATAANP